MMSAFRIRKLRNSSTGTVSTLEALIPGVRCFRIRAYWRRQHTLQSQSALDMDGEEYFERWFEVTDIVHEITDSLNGSFSAEHGIGLLKDA